MCSSTTNYVKSLEIESTFIISDDEGSLFAGEKKDMGRLFQILTKRKTDLSESEIDTVSCVEVIGKLKIRRKQPRLNIEFITLTSAIAYNALSDLSPLTSSYVYTMPILILYTTLPF